MTFVLGGAGLVLTHYLFALVLVGLPLGYVLYPSLRAKYPPRAFLSDIAWQVALSSVAIPQFLMLWGRKASLVWTRQPDYLAVLRTLVPLAVPALLAWDRPRASTARGLEMTLWLSVAAVVGILWIAALGGTNLLVPRYLDVIAVPAAILAGIGASRAGSAARFVGLSYMVLITGLGAFAVFRATGQFTAIPHEHWRAAVQTLEQAIARDPGPVLLQSGFVEQVDGRFNEDSAMLAPLRSPGQSRPSFTVHALPYVWDSAPALAQREAIVPLFEHGAQPVYVLSGGGYTALFADWLRDRLGGRVSCRPMDTFVRVELLVCRRSGGSSPSAARSIDSPQGSSGAK